MMLALLVSLLMQTPSTVPTTTIAKGEMSAIDERRDVVVRTAAEWQALWKQHNWDAPPPAVDFAKHTVVGVFLGTRPSAGFMVEITGVTKDGAALVVQYAERKPARGDVTAQVLTMPFHLVSVPAHAGQVRFVQADLKRD